MVHNSLQGADSLRKSATAHSPTFQYQYANVIAISVHTNWPIFISSSLFQSSTSNLFFIISFFVCMSLQVSVHVVYMHIQSDYAIRRRSNLFQGKKTCVCVKKLQKYIENKTKLCLIESVCIKKFGLINICNNDLWLGRGHAKNHQSIFNYVNLQILYRRKKMFLAFFFKEKFSKFPPLYQNLITRQQNSIDSIEQPMRGANKWTKNFFFKENTKTL